MAVDLRYSAAKTSKITKRLFNTSPIKKIQQDLKRKLPSQVKYTQNLAKTNNAKKTEERLVPSDYNVQLDYQLSEKEDIMVAIETISSNLWSESSTLHTKYYGLVDKRDRDMESLVFSLKGLSMKAKAEAMKFRTNQFPKDMVTTTQLYTVYEHQGNTFVDRKLEINIRNGNLRKFVITNASPVISRTVQKFQLGKVTYGHENMEVIIPAKSYESMIKDKIKALELDISNATEKNPTLEFELSALKKFHTFVMANPTALYVDLNEMTYEELSSLIGYGFVTLTSNHLNEIESHQFSISYPACGVFLKLINAGRVWLVKAMAKASYKESLEENLFKKWEGMTLNGESKMNNFRAPFYGYDLNWVLADALGSGLIEVFNTPVGRGWKLTGKA
ncbi:serine-threonine protein kinase 19-domain-containing protein [Scheffersomyces coipomensis]|uniref:serine-threonine protein kinase 19-domain-containing protein n=1 Tax=Scheffersomyces coipomensis TaxID=1788519 RepID=UPI00315C61BD